MGLAPGAVLTFARDPAVTCEVVGPSKVRFRGQEASASAAELQLMHERGQMWSAINGWDYWLHDVVKLSVLKRRDGAD